MNTTEIVSLLNGLSIVGSITESTKHLILVEIEKMQNERIQFLSEIIKNLEERNKEHDKLVTMCNTLAKELAEYKKDMKEYFTPSEVDKTIQEDF